MPLYKSLDPLTYETNKVYAGPSSATNSWIFQNLGAISGTSETTGEPADGRCSPFHFCVSSDTVDTTTSGDGYLYHFSVRGSANTNHTGGRGAFGSILSIGGTPSVDPGTGGYVGSEFLLSCSANLRGTGGGTFADWKGGIFGSNSNVYTTSAATYLALITAHEFDVTLVSSASAARKHGILVVQGNNDAVRGNFDDSAIQIANQSSASSSWAIGLQFGAYSAKWAFGTDSTLIGVTLRVEPSAGTATALYGVDFSDLTITTGGAGFLAPLITPSAANATGKAGSIVWDADYIYICTATDTWKRVAIATWP